MTRQIFTFLLSLTALPLLTQCSSITPEEEQAAIQQKNAQIAVEPAGKFFYGRRYFIPYTRFWGYLREPRQRWSTASLVVMDEASVKVPDRLRETRTDHKEKGKDHGYDANFEYRIFGHYTGQRAYEPNTDLVLPVFRITGYEVLNENPGWIFTPKEKYDETEVSLIPSLIPHGLR